MLLLRVNYYVQDSLVRVVIPAMDDWQLLSEGSEIAGFQFRAVLLPFMPWNCFKKHFTFVG